MNAEFQLSSCVYEAEDIRKELADLEKQAPGQQELETAGGVEEEEAVNTIMMITEKKGLLAARLAEVEGERATWEVRVEAAEAACRLAGPTREELEAEEAEREGEYFDVAESCADW